MTGNLNNTKTILWVAIDVAKLKHDVLIEYPNGTQKKLVIKNTLSEFKRLLSHLEKNKFKVIVGLEASGYYHRAISYFLLQHLLEVKLISAIATARTREVQYNSWDKNDQKDAGVILYLLKAGITQYYYEPLIHQTIDIQELSNTYRQVSLRKTQLQHSIQSHYLTLYFPEAEKYFCTTRASWFANFFMKFPCPHAIKKYSLQEFIDAAWDLAGRKVDKLNWLKGVYETAENSAGLPILEESKGIEMFKIILDEFHQLCQRRLSLEKLIECTLSDNQDYQRLKTLPGVGPIIAVTILAESGDLRRFSHHRKFLKFCGFDLSTQQSGQFRGQTKLSKRGNSDLRRSFWMAATIAIRMRENPFRKKYENYIKEDPRNANLKRKAYTAVAAKMAKIAYIIIKNNTDYRCSVEAQQ